MTKGVTTSRRRVLWAIALTIGGCSGGQSGTITDGEASDCEPSQTTPLGMTSDAEAGVSPEELLGRLSTSSLQAGLIWYVHGEEFQVVETQVSIDVSATGSAAVWVVQRSSSGQQQCPDYLEVTTSMRFESADGAFSESLEGRVRYTTETAAGTRFFAGIPSESLHGSYDLSTLTRQGLPDERIEFDIQLEPLFTGTVNSAASRTGHKETALVAEVVHEEAY